MIELVFVACLLTGSACEERVQALLPDSGLMGCMLTAQQQLAQWTDRNPGYRIKRWSCSFAGERPMRA